MKSKFVVGKTFLCRWRQSYVLEYYFVPWEVICDLEDYLGMLWLFPVIFILVIQSWRTVYIRFYDYIRYILP